MKDKRIKSAALTLALLLALAGVVSQRRGVTEAGSGAAQTETASRQAGGGERAGAEGEAGGAQRSSDDPRVKICKRYESCGCQSYESCMEQLKDDPTPDEPGILECIMKSSCKSLCAGKPDCGGERPGAAPKRSNCSQIRCRRDADCPGDCHGGCSEGRCYSF